MKRLTFVPGMIALVLTLPGPAAASASPFGDVMTREEQAAITPDQVLAELKAGNERFASGTLTQRDYQAQVKATAAGQFPMAAVLSCLDSRVPVEIVFDRGIGDLFVGRVAGNVEDENMLGSLEFATAVAGSKVIVVLGHSACGAVKGSIDRDAVKGLGYENQNALVDVMDPAVVTALRNDEERSSKNGALVDRVVKENVSQTIERIRTKSPDLQKLEADGKIRIVGGVYDLATGKISWL